MEKQFKSYNKKTAGKSGKQISLIYLVNNLNIPNVLVHLSFNLYIQILEYIQIVSVQKITFPYLQEIFTKTIFLHGMLMYFRFMKHIYHMN